MDLLPDLPEDFEPPGQILSLGGKEILEDRVVMIPLSWLAEHDYRHQDGGYHDCWVCAWNAGDAAPEVSS